MMTGFICKIHKKAVYRAIQGHMLIDASLICLLFLDIYPHNELGSSYDLVKKACDLLDSI